MQGCRRPHTLPLIIFILLIPNRLGRQYGAAVECSGLLVLVLLPWRPISRQGRGVGVLEGWKGAGAWEGG